MTYINPLGVDKIHKLLFRFSIPAIVGMVVSSLYNLVDRMFIGNSPDLGPNGLAGITIGFPIMTILMAVGVLFGIGGATLFSIRLGEKNQPAAEQVLGNAFAMLVITGLSFTILGQVFLRPLLRLFGASEAVLPYSLDYMRVIFCGAVFQVVSMGMNNFVRADGNPRIAMFTMFISAGTNIVLDYLFIFPLGMGMAGAALATVIAQAVSSIWVIFYFTGKHCRNRFRWANLRPRWACVSRMTALGTANFALHFAGSMLNTILNKNLLAYGGDIAVSGMGILNSLQSFLIMPIIGIRQGVQPIISYNFGARQFGRVKTASNQAMLLATAIISLGYLATRLFPRHLIGLFNQDPDLLDFGSRALTVWFMFMPIVGIQLLCANFFTAIGRPRSAMFLTLTRQVILLIPAVLIFPRIWGMAGLLYAAPFADFCSALLTGLWYVLTLRSLDRLAAAQATVPQPH